MATNREFVLEGILYRVLSDLITLEDNPASSITYPVKSNWMRHDAMLRLHSVLGEFRKDRSIYQQHPRWAEMNQQAESEG